MSERKQFLELVRDEMLNLVQEYGLKEVRVDDMPVLRRIVYANSERTIQFFLDVRDAYADCRFGPASALHEDGQPKSLESESFGSVSRILHGEGIDVPEGPKKVYDQWMLPEVVRILVDGAQRHKSQVFGPYWNSDGV